MYHVAGLEKTKFRRYRIYLLFPQVRPTSTNVLWTATATRKWLWGCTSPPIPRRRLGRGRRWRGRCMSSGVLSHRHGNGSGHASACPYQGGRGGGQRGGSCLQVCLPIGIVNVVAWVTKCQRGVDVCDVYQSRRLTGQHVYLATSCRLWRQFTLTGQCARFSVYGNCVMCLAERD